jgi:hypothetical protein
MEALPSLPVRLFAPFTLEESRMTAAGVYEHRGLLRAEGGALVLDLRPVEIDGEGDVETHRVPLADVSEVAFHEGWWRTRLVLRPRRLAAFDGVPGLVRDALVLKVRRGDRGLASRWATALSLALLDRDGFDEALDHL